MLPHVDLEERVIVSSGFDLPGAIRFLFEKILGGDTSVFFEIISTLWNVYSVIAIILSTIFFLFFLYAKTRLEALEAQQQEGLRDAERKWAQQYGDGGEKLVGQWLQIQSHLRDDNPNSWKIAIIEADIFLEQVLTDHGYSGATVGEKLKSANSASFTTIQDAWEAHKVRNEIAHAGQNDFILTRRQAQETIMRYERVFREFGAIQVTDPHESHDDHGH